MPKKTKKATEWQRPRRVYFEDDATHETIAEAADHLNMPMTRVVGTILRYVSSRGPDAVIEEVLRIQQEAAEKRARS